MLTTHPCKVTLVAGPIARRTTAIWPTIPATATRIVSTGIHDGGCSPDRFGGGATTPAIAWGKRTAAKATVPISLPSRARTSLISCRPDSRPNNMSCLWPAPVQPRSCERSVGRYSPDVSAQG